MYVQMTYICFYNKGQTGGRRESREHGALEPRERECFMEEGMVGARATWDLAFDEIATSAGRPSSPWHPRLSLNLILSCPASSAFPCQDLAFSLADSAPCFGPGYVTPLSASLLLLFKWATEN